MVNTITERQVTLLNTLQEERALDSSKQMMLEALRDYYRLGAATSSMASSVITFLMLAPRKSLEAGIYQSPEGILYRVYPGQNSGKMLCKEVVPLIGSRDVEYIYVGLASTVLSGAFRLTREEVAERTLAYGSTSCMICGRRLDDPESVDRGVGPVCWENYA